MTELKPCPLCNAPIEMEPGIDCFMFMCTNPLCGLQACIRTSYYKVAKERWNSRWSQ